MQHRSLALASILALSPIPAGASDWVVIEELVLGLDQAVSTVDGRRVYKEWTSAKTLESYGTYRIEASGTVSIWEGTATGVDAAFTFDTARTGGQVLAGSVLRVDGTRFAPRFLMLTGTRVAEGVFEYSPEHVYRAYYKADDKPVRFKLDPWEVRTGGLFNGPPNADHLSGSIRVRILEYVDEGEPRPATPTIHLDRTTCSRFGAIRVKGTGFGVRAHANIVIAGQPLLQAQTKEESGAFDRWIWIPDEVPFGPVQVYAEKSGTLERSNVVVVDVQPVDQERLIANFDALIRRYQTEVPANPHWHGALKSGKLRNFCYTLQTGVAIVKWIPTAVFSGSAAAKKLWPRAEFVCSDYQEKTLIFLDGVRFHEDLETRALMDGFDYGPVMSGVFENNALSHFFALVWPHAAALGPDALLAFRGTPRWHVDGMAFDPWLSQRPEVYEIAPGSGSWAEKSDFAAHWQLIRNGGYTNLRPERSGERDKDQYPLTGGAYYTPRGKGQGRTAASRAALGLAAPKMLYVQCPVDVEIVDSSGRRTGLDAAGTERTEIEDVELARALAEDGDREWCAALPEGRFEVRIVGKDSGSVDVRLKRAGEELAHAYPPHAIQRGIVANLIVDDGPATHPLVFSTGESVEARQVPFPFGSSPVGGEPIAGGPGGYPGAGSTPRGGTGTGEHVLVYHQQTTDGLAGEVFPAISADGRRVAFAPEPIPCPVQVMDFDGTNRRTVIEMHERPFLDLSADGARVLAATAWQLATADVGGGARWLLEGPEPEIVLARLSGDGARVFFMLGRRAAFEGLAEPLADGIWAIPAGGGAPRQVVSQAMLQRALGLPPDQGCAWRQCLDVSHDGSRVVFGVVSYGAANAGPKIFTVGGDGGGLKLVAEGTQHSYGHVGTAAITPDGSRIAYMLGSWGAPAFVATAAFDGSDTRELCRCELGERVSYPDGNSFSDPLTFSGDGGLLLLGSSGVLAATDGSAVHHLPATRTGAGRVILYGGLLRASMSADARRFAFLMGDERNSQQFKQLTQLATLEIDPPELGAAPHIADVSIEPEFRIPPGTGVTIRARVEAPHPVVITANIALREGLADSTVSQSILWDDGRRNGDEVAGDGLYTSNALYATNEAPPGPRELRVDCEVREANGRRHAAVVGVGPLPLGGTTPVAAGPPPPPARPVGPRTLVYHQETTDGLAGEVFPVLSADGQRVVFAPEAIPCPVQVMDFDGTNRRTVIEMHQRGALDISADGARVLASTSWQVATADVGGAARWLLEGPEPEIVLARLSGDGARVFFMLGRRAAFEDLAEPLADGIWAIPAGGGAPRQVVSQAMLQRALGLPPDQGCAWRQCLDVSHDGSRVVFGVVSYGAANAGPKIFTVGGDGSGLKLVAEGTKHSYGHVGTAAITPDGSRIAYMLGSWGAPAFVATAAFDGSGTRELCRCELGQRVSYPDGNSFSDPLTFCADGSRLLLGSSGVLVATDGSGTLDHLPATRSTGGRFVLYGGLSRATMSADARRYVFLMGDERNPHQFKQFTQLATLEIDPPELRGAPTLTDIEVGPDTLVPGQTVLHASVRVESPHQIVVATAAALLEGQADPRILQDILWDDGQRAGDKVAGDGVHTHSAIYASAGVVQGPRVLRIDAEVREADGRRHATAIDAWPFQVVVSSGL